MIVSLRGANGSGKSYCVRRLLQFLKAKPGEVNAKGKIQYYLTTLSDGKTLGVLGSYKTACGGCDGIQPYSEIWPRVVDLRGRADHVLFEGAIVSSGYGTIGKASEEYAGNDEFVFAFLNTPVEVCIQHVQARRDARGETKPFDTFNLIHKFRAVQLSLKALLEVHRRPVTIIDYHKSMIQLVALFLYGYAPPTEDSPQFPSEIPVLPRKRRKDRDKV